MKVRRPRSLAAFRRRGLRVVLACARSGEGRATLRVAGRKARRLGLRRRVLAARAFECVAGERVAVRLKPRRRVARRLVGRRLKVTVRVDMPGAGRLQRELTIRSRSGR